MSLLAKYLLDHRISSADTLITESYLRVRWTSASNSRWPPRPANQRKHNLLQSCQFEAPETCPGVPTSHTGIDGAGLSSLWPTDLQTCRPAGQLQVPEVEQVLQEVQVEDNQHRFLHLSIRRPISRELSEAGEMQTSLFLKPAACWLTSWQSRTIPDVDVCQIAEASCLAFLTSGCSISRLLLRSATEFWSGGARSQPASSIHQSVSLLQCSALARSDLDWPSTTVSPEVCRRVRQQHLIGLQAAPSLQSLGTLKKIIKTPEALNSYCYLVEELKQTVV